MISSYTRRRFDLLALRAFDRRVVLCLRKEASAHCHRIGTRVLMSLNYLPTYFDVRE